MGVLRKRTDVLPSVYDVREQILGLRDGLSQLTDQVAEVMATTGAGALDDVKSRVARVKSGLDGAVSVASERGRDVQVAARDAAEDLTDALEEALHARPFLTIAVAIGVGYLLAVARRR
jgi:ElaB/YqjD/DUF883 family membrane-anchored ribosome-binding protein